MVLCIIQNTEVINCAHVLNNGILCMTCWDRVQNVDIIRQDKAGRDILYGKVEQDTLYDMMGKNMIE